VNITNLISEIDAEILRLQEAHALLAGASSPAAKKRGCPARVVKVVKSALKPAKAATKVKRNLSPEGCARIAAAAKAFYPTLFN